MKTSKSQNLKSIPTGYKQTEAGIIPEDWKVSSIGDLCVIFGRIGFRGYTKADIVSQDQGVLSISPSNIFDGRTNFAHGTYITRQKYEESPEIKIYEDDILLVKTGSTYGKIALVKNLKEDATLNPQVVVFKRLKSPAAFLAYVMQSDIVQNQIEETIVGGAIPTLSQKVVSSYKIPLPAPSEQLAIANVLSETDALIIAIEKLIAKKQAIKTASMQQLLTGRTRLPQFAKHPTEAHNGYKTSDVGQIPTDWEVRPFGEITRLSSSRINPKIKGGGDLCIELEHIQPNTGYLLGKTCTTRDSSLKNTFESGDILFGKLRAYLKKYWFANISGVCSTEFWVFKPEDQLVISKFIYYIIQTDNFIATAAESYGTHMPRADWKVVKDYQVILPKIEEQTAITTFLSDMDAELEALEQKLAKVRDIKQGMMQQLLTGRIRLPLDQQS